MKLCGRWINGKRIVPIFIGESKRPIPHFHSRKWHSIHHDSFSTTCWWYDETKQTIQINILQRCKYSAEKQRDRKTATRNLFIITNWIWFDEWNCIPHSLPSINIMDDVSFVSNDKQKFILLSTWILWVIKTFSVF